MTRYLLLTALALASTVIATGPGGMPNKTQTGTITGTITPAKK